MMDLFDTLRTWRLLKSILNRFLNLLMCESDPAAEKIYEYGALKQNLVVG